MMSSGPFQPQLTCVCVKRMPTFRVLGNIETFFNIWNLCNPPEKQKVFNFMILKFNIFNIIAVAWKVYVSDMF